MNGYLKRLQKIQDACVEKQSINVVVEENMDEFTRLKKKIAFDVKSVRLPIMELIKKDIRQLIHDRDEMEEVAPGTVATVELSQNIRKALKILRIDATHMELLQKNEKAHYIKMNKQNEETEKQIEHREEILGTVIDHMEECKQLYQKRHGESAFSKPVAPKDPLITQLPNIDDADFQLLQKNDQVINGLLDDISAGVNDMRHIAIEMGNEAESQGVKLEELNNKAEKVNDQLDNINVRLYKALENVRKGDRFILDLILLCVLLGLCGYIYSIVR